MESRDPGAGWTPPGAPPSRSVAQLIAEGTLDADLAAIVWLRVEGRVPLVVGAGPRLVGKTTLLNALLDFLPPDIGTRQIRGRTEDFSWLPDPLELGWPGEDVADLVGRLGRFEPAEGGSGGGGAGSGRPNGPGSAAGASIAAPENTYLVAAELSNHTPWYTWGLRARVLIRALQLGYGLGATIHIDSLEDLFDELTARPVELSEDEIRRLGVVIIARRIRVPDGGSAATRGVDDEGTIRRVVAAHYLRPVERDGEGHLQRRPPVVLATWDPARDDFDHFGWGAAPELALRVGRTQAEFERELSLRAAFLREVVDAGRTSVPAFRAALATYRGGGSAHTHTHPAN
jgi:hypothetical protein